MLENVSNLNNLYGAISEKKSQHYEKIKPALNGSLILVVFYPY